MRIFFSAGEPSGDQHSARLIRELQSRHSEFQAEGFGGPNMRDAGCQLHFELTELAVMGFLRVVPLLAKFRRLVKQAEAYFDTNPPDAFKVLVAAPEIDFASRCHLSLTHRCVEVISQTVPNAPPHNSGKAERGRSQCSTQ